ncbi:unnamed protein product (macronuclear) [Paramecium tetraurelia]|uniref:Chromosome undetermined scaffold_15, whole genome shotgun sequence n=1 Tax=Paramecium tetraurelia TaxID=5888 RepID=Q3SE69_PARTE|nr:uncharacterized protein GSPATT00006401001 [Paramecium tetraurelia]CAI39055.1 Protein containing mutated RNA-dependent RNA polymerase domain [Paramecium tetraurelia]CAK65902.1 unnamed protein product [Paramecium tetraurelia]|eukprot:XP_001433299.1 hypothetical protein (macronuclear) [Paramecium tetraurelia strain d4-2]
MQIHIKIISQPPKRSASDIYQELKNWLKKNEINLNIHCIKLKPEPVEELQNQIKKSQFWNSKILKSISEDSIVQFISKIEPKLYNDSKFVLGKQLDYCEMIEDLLVKPQEDLFGVPNWHPTIRPQNLQQVSQGNTQCYIYFYGQDIQKLRLYEDEKNQKQISLFGKQYLLKGQAQRRELKIIKDNFKSIPGIEFQFGILSKVFYQYWSTAQIQKYYNEDTFQVQDINLELQNTQVRVYFSLILDRTRKINCLIQFQTKKDGNVKEVEYNKTYSNGGIIVDKSKDENQINFYIKVLDTPKCYIQEDYDYDKYKNQKDIKFWRSQNFVQNDIRNIIQAGIIRQSSSLKFTVHHSQTQNENFYNFCQEIENQGYLEKFMGDQHIQMKRISELSKTEDKFNVRIGLNWMLLSAAFGRCKMIQPNIKFQDFIEQVKELPPLAIAYQIKNLKQKKQEKKDKEIFQFDKFLDIVKKNGQKHPEDILEETLLADLTPTGILPNYSIQECIPFYDLERFWRQQIKGKLQTKSKGLMEEIVKIRIRDDNFEILRQKQFDKHQQKHFLFSGYFRELLKGKLNIVERNYKFLGYDCRGLRKGEFYAINSEYFENTYQYMFQQLMKSYENNQRIVKCSQIQKIFNEHLNHINTSLSLNEIENKLLDKKFELDIQQDQLQKGPLIQTKVDTKQINRKKTQENNYNYKILMPQGKASNDVIKLMNEIAFEGQNTDYCCFIIRYQNYKGMLTKMANPNKEGVIRLYDNMIDKNSPTNQYMEGLNQKCWVEKKKLDEIQILGVPEFKPCVLRLFQILNIISLEVETNEKKVFKAFRKYFHMLKQTVSKQNDPNQDPFYMRTLKQYERKQEYLLPVKKGAYLMGVYDPLLQPDEVFINVQYEEENQSFVVQDQKIIIFKKNYLMKDAISLFQNTSKANQELLAQRYKNVIVFSVHMLGDKFPQDEFDDKQKFVAIWDQKLIPDIAITLFDGKNYCKSFKNKIQGQNSQNQASIDQHFDKTEWLSGLQTQAIDFFCVFQQSCNFNELKTIYTKIMLQNLLYQRDASFQKIFEKITIQLKIINIIGMKYASTQAQKTNVFSLIYRLIVF